MEMEEKILLRDPDVEPTDKVIEDSLGKDAYEIYKTLIEVITGKYKLAYEWRFYKDGNAWLCKVTNKKKTVFWLSLWGNIHKNRFLLHRKDKGWN